MSSESHGGDTAQVLVAPFMQKKRRHGGEAECYEGERNGVGEPVAVAILPARKGAHEFDDAAQEKQGECKDCAELDDDGVHLPVGVVERNLHEGFSDSQMRRRANG